MQLRPGETFGRYQLADLLGRGGMGEVYSAYDTVLHRKVALKVLTVRPAAALSDTERADRPTPSTGGAARILREARAAAGIAHPNAVSIYDVGEIEGVSFLAMELVAGRTLRTFVGDDSIPLGRRIRWIADVARALGAAHKLNLVHRDIKPENVMVRDDGFVKVLDFGIARRTVTKEEAVRLNPADLAALAKFGQTSGTLTAEGTILGTPMYMAPEQLMGDAIDGRTDEFAWGVLAYELLTGKLPWEGNGPQMLSQILSREIAPLTDRAPDVPARVDAAIRRALNKRPSARFASIDEAADELEPFAATTGQAKVLTASDPDPAFAPTEPVAVSSNGAISKRETAPEPARARRVDRLVLSAVAAIGVTAAVIVGVRAFGSKPAAHATITDEASADLPSQMSNNPDATAAYRAGLQALRDGSWAPALKQLNRSIELDPRFAAAHLRLALAKLLGSYSARITTADLQGARTAQADLGARDRVLLDAFAHLTRDPPDFGESERLLAAAAKRYPSDADLAFQHGVVLDLAQRQAEAEGAFDTAITLDPQFAFGWRMKARVLTELDDVPGATKALAKCLHISPGATTCLFDIAAIQTNTGECADLVRTSRRGIALLPDSPMFYLWLAQGLVGSGEPVEAVHAALQQSWDHQPAETRAFAEAASDAALAVLAGDFAGADRRYGALEKAIQSSTDASQVFDVAYEHVLLEIEIGRSAEALRLADRYLRASAAPSKGVGAYDYSLFLNAAALEAGGITRPKFDQLRDSWLARNADQEPAYRWINAYALPVATREEAQEALAVKPTSLVSVLVRTPDLAEPIGRVLSLGGRLDEGIGYLRAASESCNVLDGIRGIFSTWASFDLGRALEERGDVPGACKAYRAVLDRWGKAQPASRTAAKALGRTRVLACTTEAGVKAEQKR